MGSNDFCYRCTDSPVKDSHHSSFLIDFLSNFEPAFYQSLQDGTTPLHHAVSSSDAAIVGMLLRRGSNVNTVAKVSHSKPVSSLVLSLTPLTLFRTA
jgi:ankyrin repeat protein